MDAVAVADVGAGSRGMDASPDPASYLCNVCKIFFVSLKTLTRHVFNGPPGFCGTVNEHQPGQLTVELTSVHVVQIIDLAELRGARCRQAVEGLVEVDFLDRALRQVRSRKDYNAGRAQVFHPVPQGTGRLRQPAGNVQANAHDRQPAQVCHDRLRV